MSRFAAKQSKLPLTPLIASPLIASERIRKLFDHVPCLNCGYDLFKTTAANCPECGVCLSQSLNPHRVFLLKLEQLRWLRSLAAYWLLTMLFWLIWVGSTFLNSEVYQVLCFQLCIGAILAVAVASWTVIDRLWDKSDALVDKKVFSSKSTPFLFPPRKRKIIFLVMSLLPFPYIYTQVVFLGSVMFSANSPTSILFRESSQGKSLIVVSLALTSVCAILGYLAHLLSRIPLHISANLLRIATALILFDWCVTNVAASDSLIILAFSMLPVVWVFLVLALIITTSALSRMIRRLPE